MKRSRSSPACPAPGAGFARSVLARGLTAGAPATAVEAVWTRAQIRALGGRRPVVTPDVMIQRLARNVTGHTVNDNVAAAAGALMRAGYGPAWAVVWTAAMRGRRFRPLRDTVLLGGVIWLVELVTLPALRATPPLRCWRPIDIVLDLSNGLVFAAVTNAVLRRQRSRTPARNAGPR